ncbi:fumarylacetoacetate hydrolase family protein [Candidatus Omnitrophota bacterium]
MRIVHFKYDHKENWGVVKKGVVHVLKTPPYKGISYSGVTVPFQKISLLAPATPSKIVLVGLNYKNHAKELSMKIPKEPIIFLKPPTAVINPYDAIVYPKSVARLDYEAELALVIKKKAHNISEKEASKYILGYTCCNDVTARDLQKKDGQWTRAKSFDTFCPVGPWIETKLDPSAVKVRTFLNENLQQNSCTSQFIFSVSYLVSFISSVMTLNAGDVISTGTPPGVGSMKVGDHVRVNVDGIGELENTVTSCDK